MEPVAQPQDQPGPGELGRLCDDSASPGIDSSGEVPPEPESFPRASETPDTASSQPLTRSRTKPRSWAARPASVAGTGFPPFVRFHDTSASANPSRSPAPGGGPPSGSDVADSASSPAWLVISIHRPKIGRASCRERV